VREGSKPSFFEKKDQKTFALTRRGRVGADYGVQAFATTSGGKFFASFFQKRSASFASPWL
jgi:hypothetical protein